MCPEYITLKEFCQLTKISTSTAYRMIRNGTLAGSKAGRDKTLENSCRFSYIPSYKQTT